MTLTRPSPVDLPTVRDSTIDAVRAGSLLVVVALHAVMIGAWEGDDGTLNTVVALAGHDGFVPVTWIVQVMPLFFIAGGYVSLLQWRRMRAAGASAGAYARRRIRRLVIPVTVMAVVVGGALLTSRALGMEPALLAEAGLRIGQPLWFLAVYLGVTALVPLMARLHDRRPLAVLAVLAAMVLTVDLVGAGTGLPIGYLNLAFVWLLMQQLGFAMLDGRTAQWTRRRLYAALSACAVALSAIVVLGWSPDMLVNLNPPTFALALLGGAQFFALQLARPWLDRVTGRPAVAQAVAAAGTRAMSVYLWHMPLAMALVAGMWSLGLPLPEPSSPGWWATRVPWFLAVLACALLSTGPVERLERLAMRIVDASASQVRAVRWRGPLSAALPVILAIAGTMVALLMHLDAPLAVVVAAGLLGAAAVLSSPSMPPAPGLRSVSAARG